MRRTIITNLQWWLFIALNAIMWGLVRHLSEFAWWWQILIGVAYYAAVMLIFRMSWETSTQAYERRKDARRRRWLRKYMSDEQRKAAADRASWLREP